MGAHFFNPDGGERSVDCTSVESLLRQCREQCPTIWNGLNKSIDEGLNDRKVPLRMRNVGGRAAIPEEFYQEASVSELDSVEPALSAEARVSGDDQAKATDQARPAGTSRAW